MHAQSIWTAVQILYSVHAHAHLRTHMFVLTHTWSDTHINVHTHRHIIQTSLLPSQKVRQIRSLDAHLTERLYVYIHAYNTSIFVAFTLRHLALWLGFYSYHENPLYICLSRWHLAPHCEWFVVAPAVLRVSRALAWTSHPPCFCPYPPKSLSYMGHRIVWYVIP